MYGLEAPVYKIEQLVRPRPSAEVLEDFEGPLDLILYLLSKNKIEIQDIPIALILEQYVAYLKAREAMDLEVASEFITMATHLMYIKTRMLLSLEDEEAKDEMAQLIKSLEERRNSEIYHTVQEVLPEMERRSKFGEDTFVREPEPMEQETVYIYCHQKEDLLKAFLSLEERRERLVPLSVDSFAEIVKKEPYPVKNKALEILTRLREHGVTCLLKLFRGSRSKSELVATFLAVLELCKGSFVKLSDGETDCMVTPLRTDGEMPEEAKEGFFGTEGIRSGS